MGIIKVRSWELVLIKRLGLPILERLNSMVTRAAKEDPEENLLDVVAGACETITEFLNSPDAFEIT
ncbi:MAG: hypothetical protein SV375_11375 [Thermodesulfobacteriota bacterium]|nr:hypothetical protein [Thermodesulfobacteriota bacterium]